MSMFFGKSSSKGDLATEASSPGSAKTTEEDAASPTAKSPSSNSLKALYKSAKRAAGIPSKKDAAAKEAADEAATVDGNAEDGEEDDDEEGLDVAELEAALPDDDEDKSPDAFTEDEIKALRETKALLLSDKYKMTPEEIGARELMVVVMNCKCRVDEAAMKYHRWHTVAALGVGLKSIPDAFTTIGKNAENLKGTPVEKWSLMTFRCVGRDTCNRSIMWIYANKIPPAEEQNVLRSSFVYFVAAHADLRSMRRGLTFVLDTDADDWKESYGNEAKMQKIWQCMPLRSQRIFILGANMVKRVLINAALALASLFTKEKVLRRIKFADDETVKKEITEENLPIYKGGKNAGVTQDDALLKYLSDRLANFPKLPDDI